VIDHVTIRVDALDASKRFYAHALEVLDGSPPSEGGGFVEWSDFSIAQATAERPATRQLHVAFQAPSRERVDAWWTAMTGAGFADDGRPGLRPQYAPSYYGAFVRDPDGNSVEAVHIRPPRRDGMVLDHLWLRVSDLTASTRFYAAVALQVGHVTTTSDGRTTVRGDGASISLVEGSASANVHLAFAAPDRETVHRFHATGLAAGFESCGNPGDRPEYHPGYYGAYLADPDDNVIEAVFHDR
jgi:catechol 2,3-dioxygenase-like lactoylglutathione lyase family enzyme